MLDRRTYSILVACADPNDANTIGSFLSGLACRIIVTSDPEETLAYASTGRPDLILLGVSLPKFNGFDVCKQLKIDPLTGDIPILMITALHETSDIERGVEAGADDLSKPLYKRILRKRVRSLLGV